MAIVLIFIFVIIALIHFNWAIGGTWGFDAALPSNEQGERLFTPRKIDSAIVGIGLLLFAAFYAYQNAWFSLNVPNWLVVIAKWGIPAIFLLRAIGDFKYVGFFKSIKSTIFAKRDTQLYSPLCLFIATLGILLNFL